ncbi:MAG: hypothetical protein G01um10148_788 [Parcubacteria group bacterium Gr01-1014_8]|nr:MAG: hypothetical protein G01um10148_788 [Parcubacteria group bacterium Gr01-1014_8]
MRVHAVYTVGFLASVVMILLIPGWILAALPTGLTPKVTFSGAASTYNPQCEAEQWNTSTGQRYNPNEWAAALQQGYAQKYRCGYGTGRVCCAVVQEPGGRALILKINDNGPLKPGRVIDLNEKSMRYLSYEKFGNCNGLIPRVSVALLDGSSCPMGPVEEADKKAWNDKVVSAPADTGPVGPSAATGVPAPSGFPTTIGQAYQGNQPTQAQQYMPSQPAVAQNQPGGMQPTSYFNPQQPAQNPSMPLPSMSQPAAQDSTQIESVTERISNFLKGGTTEKPIDTKSLTFDSRVSSKVILSPEHPASGSSASTSSSTPLAPSQTFVSPDMAFSEPSEPVNQRLIAILETIRLAALKLLARLRQLVPL